jgi:hypothetical protein
MPLDRSRYAEQLRRCGNAGGVRRIAAADRRAGRDAANRGDRHARRWTSSLTIRAKHIVLVILLALSPSPSRAASLDRLSCNGLMVNYVGAGEYASLECATLDGNSFSGVVSLGLKRPSFAPRAPKDLQDARQGLMLGFQLDDSATTGIRTAVDKYSTTINLEFPHLKRGKHRLRIGILFRGDLSLDSAYCFSTPDWAMWIR